MVFAQDSHKIIHWFYVKQLIMSPVFKHIDQLRSVIKKTDYARFLIKKQKGNAHLT